MYELMCSGKYCCLKLHCICYISKASSLYAHVRAFQIHRIFETPSRCSFNRRNFLTSACIYTGRSVWTPYSALVFITLISSFFASYLLVSIATVKIIVIDKLVGNRRFKINLSTKTATIMLIFLQDDIKRNTLKYAFSMHD